MRGGTHAAATGEVGVILVRGTERVRDALRVQFLCGGRAVRRARTDYRSAAHVAAALSCALDEVPDLASKQQARLRESEQRLRRLERDLAELQAQALHASSAPASNGTRHISIPSQHGVDAARALALALARLPGVLAVGAVEDPPTLLIATSADSGLDASKLLRDAIGPYSGRGGGSPRMAQGSLPSIDAVRSAARAVTAERLRPASFHTSSIAAIARLTGNEARLYSLCSKVRPTVRHSAQRAAMPCGCMATHGMRKADAAWAMLVSGVNKKSAVPTMAMASRRLGVRTYSAPPSLAIR